MKTTKILKKRHKWFLSLISFGLMGAVALAACTPSTNTNSTTSASTSQNEPTNVNSEGSQTSNKPQNPQANQGTKESEKLSLTNALIQRQSFKRYLTSFSTNLEEAFQIPKNTLSSDNLLPTTSNPDFKYVFQEFFVSNETVVGSLAGTNNEVLGMYKTIGANTDDQNQQTIYGYLAALSPSTSTRSKRSADSSLFVKIKAQLASLLDNLNQLKEKFEVATKETRTSKQPDYLTKQAAVLLAANELVKQPSSTNFNVLKSNVEALKSLVNPVLSGLEKVTANINELKTDFSDLSKALGANNTKEISENTQLNSLLNKFSELFVTTKAAADNKHEITLPFDAKASLLQTDAASKVVTNLNEQVDFASFYTKVHANDATTINLLADQYNSNVDADLTNLRKDKSKNLLVLLRNNQNSEFLKNLKILRTSLESYKVLLGDETEPKSVSFALKEALAAINADQTAENYNKDHAETAVTNLMQYLKKFKTEFPSLQTDLERFTTSLEGLEAKTEKIMADLEKAVNFGDLLNVISQSVALKSEILEINNLVPLLNEDNTTNPLTSFNLGAKIEALREQDTLRQLGNQGDKLWEYIGKMPSEGSEALKTALKKVTNETDLDGVRVQTGALDQLLYGTADWNATKTPTYALNGYEGKKAQNSSLTDSNLKDFLSNFGTSNRNGLTTLGEVQKLINENYILEANFQASAILNKIIEAVK